LGAQIHHINVTGSIAGGPGSGAGIVHGSGVEVAVASMNIEVLEGWKSGERIGGVADHVARQGFIGGLTKKEAAATGQGIEEARTAGHREGGACGFLEEGAAAGFVLKHTGDAQSEPGGIVEFWAGSLMRKTWDEGEEGFEKGGGERRDALERFHNRKNRILLTY